MATTEGSSLQGDNVCVYRITESGVQEISDKGVFTVLREGFEHLISSSKNSSTADKNNSNALIIKKCCPGYHSINNQTCIESRVSNPFSESQFSYALIYLGILLIVVGLVSMFIAYRYHYRFQRNQKHGLICNSYDDAAHSHSVECQSIPINDPKSPEELLMQH